MKTIFPIFFFQCFAVCSIGAALSKFKFIRSGIFQNGLNYAICIRRHFGACSITFTNELNGREDAFELINVDDNGNLVPSPGQAAAEIFSCQDDYIAFNSVRLCGYKLNDGSVSGNISLNAPVNHYMNGPIVIPFKTDNALTGRGFKLFYFQEKCK